MFNYLYWKFDKVISKDLCKFFLNSFNWEDSEKGIVKIKDGFGEDKKIRNSNVIFLQENNPLGCINFYHGLMANINSGWNFNLYTQEQTQITRYEKNEHYDWHVDTFPPVNDLQRKLSVVTLLSDTKDFEGGNFLLKNCKDQPTLNQGDILVFPSILEHKVMPVTKGTRYSAVNWINGVSFR